MLQVDRWDRYATFGMFMPEAKPAPATLPRHPNMLDGGLGFFGLCWLWLGVV